MSNNGVTLLFNEIAKIIGYYKFNSSVPDPFSYSGIVEKLNVNLGSKSPVEKAVMKFLGFKPENSDD